MTDLHDKLICRHGGENSRITIEHHRERHCNSKGRNLESDFESLAPAREAPTTLVVRPPSSPTGSEGVHGACTTSPDGCLSAQVLAPPVGEVRRDG
jgi:hypothetical protein